MPPDNVFLPQERVCCKQKNASAKSLISVLFEIDDSACITFNCKRRGDFCVRSFDFEKTAKFTEKMDRKSEKCTRKFRNQRLFEEYDSV